MTGASLAWAFLVAWGATALSRLPPGMLTVVAGHMAATRGRRATAMLLAGGWLADLCFTTALTTSVMAIPSEFLGPAFRTGALAAAMAVAALVLLSPPTIPMAPAPPTRRYRTASPVATGFFLSLSTPGLWSWWATIGAALMSGAGGREATCAVAGGILAGVTTWSGLMVAVLPRVCAVRFSLAPAIRRAAGILLLVSALGLVLLAFLA